MNGRIKIQRSSSGKEYIYIEVTYMDRNTGKRRSITRGTGMLAEGHKREAKEMIPKIMKEYSYLEREDIPEDYDILLTDYIDHWLAIKKTEVETSTYQIYCYKTNTIKEYFKMNRVMVRKVTPGIVDAFIHYELEYGKKSQKDGSRSPLSARTVRDLKNILYQVFTQAMIEGINIANPANGLKVRSRRCTDKDEKYLFLTEQDLESLMYYIKKEKPELLGITYLGAYYGLRREEILGLKWTAIDFKKKIIHIRHTVVHAGKTLRKDTTKTNAGRRDLMLFPVAEKCLNDIQRSQEENEKFWGDAYNDTQGYVFTASNGTPYDPNYVSDAFHRTTIKFGRPEITLHKLRHTCASLLINRGCDLKQMQYWLGHSDGTTTLNIYSHYDKHRLNASKNDLMDISKDVESIF